MTCVFAVSDKASMYYWHVAIPGIWAAHSDYNCTEGEMVE